MPDLRKNLQVRQPGIQGDDVNDSNGWPTPLSDPSSPLRMAVTNGQSGSQSNFDPTSTSVQNDLSLAEGRSSGSTGNQADQGGHGDKLKTSQQNAGDHSMAEATAESD